MRLIGGICGWLVASLLFAGRVKDHLARRRLRAELFEFLIDTDSGLNFHNFRREDVRKFLGVEDPEVYRHFDEKLVDEIDAAIKARYRHRREAARSGLRDVAGAVDYLASEGVLDELGLSATEAVSRMQTLVDGGPSPLEAKSGFVRYAPSQPPEGPVRYPAEFEPVGAVLLAWPIYYPGKWSVHARLVREISTECAAVVLVPDEWWQATVSLYLASVSPAVELPLFMRVRLDDVWMRDFGPTTVLHGPEQAPAMIANPYAEDFISYMKYDAEVAAEVGRTLDVPVFRLPLVVEGGNVETDGKGTLLMTDAVLEKNPDIDDRRLRTIAESYFGCGRLLLVPHQPRDVVGHVDTMVKLTDERTTLVPRVHAGHPGHDSLERTAELLSTTPAASGEPFHVMRLPEPGGGDPAASKDWSYANSLFVNGKVLVPVYDHEEDEEALAVYRAARPDLQIIAVDYTPYAIGGLHCQTKDIPACGLPPAMR